ncbi:MAG: glucuronate isomerase, partial [Anaerohalosphaera sp.]|nr:glucuronate isomerase [Anaerohalosphaera sp.]
MSDDFLLQSEAARKLYHEHAAKMPIFDYHCHIVPGDIAEDKRYENLTQVWLYGDHYKWRAMRSNGVAEKYCTGDASDWEKFEKWAETVPYTMGNPLYHWTHLELKNVFGIEGMLLGPDTAREIYDQCSEMLQEPEFSCRGLMRQANVRAICTTDDPTDSLEHHAKIKADGFEIKVLPTWRPDKGMATEDVAALNTWIDKLGESAKVEVVDFGSYLEAINVRHGFFHEMGCRLSDHGLETAYSEGYTAQEIAAIFAKLRGGAEISEVESLKFKSAMMYEFGIMDHAAGWTQQIHFGPIRSNSSRMAKLIGPDTGFDSIGDLAIAKPLARYLDGLDVVEKLPRTILYNINPS